MLGYRRANQQECDQWKRDEMELYKTNAKLAKIQLETPQDFSAAFNGYDFNVYIIDTWDRLTLIEQLRKCEEHVHDLKNQLRIKSNECNAWKKRYQNNGPN
jgi:collagenase-like PrtC family protease